jgi:hypothetical protein
MVEGVQSLKDRAAISAITDEDVLQVLLKEIVPFLER